MDIHLYLKLLIQHYHLLHQEFRVIQNIRICYHQNHNEVILCKLRRKIILHYLNIDFHILNLYQLDQILVDSWQIDLIMILDEN